MTGSAGKTDCTGGPPVDDATLFDLASVTKPVVACLFARLWLRGAIHPDTRLGTLVAEADGTPAGAVRLELLLSHRAGLAAHRDLFEPLTRNKAVDRTVALRAAARAMREDCRGVAPSDGFPPVYSDLGFLLLGEALARRMQTPLDDLIEREVCRPLRLDIASARLWERGAPDRLARAAATETVAFRGGPVRGAVHDENAWALGELGACGHAGLFGTAESVARLGAALLDSIAGAGTAFLPAWVVRWLVRERPGGTLRAGFDGKSATGSSAGAAFGKKTFGHLGFTGTSLWCDPDVGVSVAILTNRVCPTRANTTLRTVRPVLGERLHGLATELDQPDGPTTRPRMGLPPPCSRKKRPESRASAVSAWPGARSWAG